MNIELKPIAESKVRQLGGDVCGVLVRTEDSEVMAVSEHGRCTRLDAGVMGPVEGAQSGQGAEPVAWECSGEPGLYDNITRDKGEADHHRKIGRTVRPLVYGDTQPQPAVPEGWSVVRPNHTAGAIGTGAKGFLIQSPRVNGVAANTAVWEDSENPAEQLLYLMLSAAPQPAVPEGFGCKIDKLCNVVEDACDEVEYVRHTKYLINSLRSLLSTPTTPQADGWVRCEDRLPTEADADLNGKVWCFLPERGLNEVALFGSKEVAFFWRRDQAITHWAPTGLKRPQPPKQEGA